MIPNEEKEVREGKSEGGSLLLLELSSFLSFF